jgi:hypothetical protein
MQWSPANRNGDLQPVAVNGLRVARTQRRPRALGRKEVHHSSVRFAQQLRLACAAASEPDVRMLSASLLLLRCGYLIRTLLTCPPHVGLRLSLAQASTKIEDSTQPMIVATFSHHVIAVPTLDLHRGTTCCAIPN